MENRDAACCNVALPSSILYPPSSKTDCRLPAALKTVPNAWLGEQVGWMGRVGLELVAKLGDEDAQGRHILLVGADPNRLKSMLCVSTLPACVASVRSRSYSVGVRWTACPPSVTCRCARSIVRSPNCRTGSSLDAPRAAWR